MATLDWLVVVTYAIVILAVGIATARRTQSESEYFLAGRDQGWASVAASTWATKLSALTFIGVPGAAISGNFAYVQLWFGTFAAAYIVTITFIPEFYRLRISTVYEYLEHRLGPRTRLGGTWLFMVSRCLASAVRLAGCAIAVSVFFELSLATAIFLVAALATAYVMVGGLRAVIWTDVLQLVLFLAGAAIAILYISANLPGGFGQIMDIGAAANKFQIFDFSFNMSDGTTFWLGNLFALVLGVAVGAADQDIAQRALACRNASQARIALITAGIADLGSTFLFLTVGVAVFAFYTTFPQEAVTALIADNRNDYVFPHFIRHELPAGLRGLLVAALFAAAMSSLDSALAGLTSSAYFDLGLAKHTTRLSDTAVRRTLVILFALILAAIAYALGSQPSILWFGFKIMGYTYGGLLGLFILAYVAPERTHDAANTFAAFSSIAVVIAATQVDVGWGVAPWPWAILIGLGWTFAIALALGAIMRRRAEA